ncbi:TRAP transporter substrate-binding protein DctP [Niallia sp. Krafla_26]|uniref:TRAP transporter substrate-binding protein DctP n=1 Tax=Niallia sp. Krafla_26 TaxID=3064703 RepID=UPI003D17778F
MKGFKLSLLIQAIFCFMVLTACSSQSSNSSNSSNSNGSDPTKDNPIVFKTTIQTPQVASMSKGFDAYLDAIEEKSEGKIKFERYYSESLVKSADVVDALSAGIADIGIIIPALAQSKIPLNTFGNVPAIFENSWPGARAAYDLYEQMPQLNEELEKHGIIFAGSLGVPSTYVFTKDPINGVEDLKGQKLIAQGDHGIIAKELGAAPVSIPSTEAFEALQRGTADGILFNLTMVTTYNIEQVASHLYKLPIGGVDLLIGMNSNKFNALPDNLKLIFKEVAKPHADDFHQIYQVEGDKIALSKIEQANGSVTETKAEDVEKLKEIAQNIIWKSWVEKSGADAQEVLNKYIELSEKYERENPYKEE